LTIRIVSQAQRSAGEGLSQGAVLFVCTQDQVIRIRTGETDADAL
jgi:nitrogen regulatory protein PII